MHELKNHEPAVFAARSKGIVVPTQLWEEIKSVVKSAELYMRTHTKVEYSPTCECGYCRFLRLSENISKNERLAALAPQGMNHFCVGESGLGEWSCRSEVVPSICHYCKKPNMAINIKNTETIKVSNELHKNIQMT